MSRCCEATERADGAPVAVVRPPWASEVEMIEKAIDPRRARSRRPPRDRPRGGTHGQRGPRRARRGRIGLPRVRALGASDPDGVRRRSRDARIVLIGEQPGDLVADLRLLQPEAGLSRAPSDVMSAVMAGSQRLRCPVEGRRTYRAVGGIRTTPTGPAADLSPALAAGLLHVRSTRCVPGRALPVA